MSDDDTSAQEFLDTEKQRRQDALVGLAVELRRLKGTTEGTKVRL